MWFSFRLLLAVTKLHPRERRDLVLENLALRHQLAIYQRSQRRPVLEKHARRFWSTLARGWSGWPSGAAAAFRANPRGRGASARGLHHVYD